MRLVDVLLGLPSEALEFVQGAGVHSGLQQLADHHHRDDRLRVAVPVLRINYRL
jgi:hypothetical protein